MAITSYQRYDIQLETDRPATPTTTFKGLQTVMLPASGGAVVEFTVKKAGTYPIVTHQFHHAQNGAAALLKVTE